MEPGPLSGKKRILKTLLVYLGGAWVFIEAFNFIIDKYRLDSTILDLVIILVIFGLPAAVIHAWFDSRFTKMAIILHAISAGLALATTGYLLISPDRINTSRLSLLRFKSEQKKLAESIRSLAILPFDSYTPDNSHAYLVAGMHDALINELGQVGAIRVISKTSSSKYAATRRSVQEIARELNVDAIIEGSVLDVEHMIRIQLKLVCAFPEERQLWAETYEIPHSELVNLYGEITRNIVNEINITLEPETEQVLSKTQFVNPDAYEAYLKGNFNVGFLTREGILAAQDYYTRSISLDPQFAPAYGGLAGTWIVLKQMDFVSSDEADPLIEKYVTQAMRLDSTVADVWYCKATKLCWTDFKWAESEHAFKKCIALNPNHAVARALYAHLLMIMNRWDQAWEQMNRALEIDPQNIFIKALSGVLLCNSGRYEEYLVAFVPIAKANPNLPLVNYGLWSAYAHTGNYREALLALKKILAHLGQEEAAAMLDGSRERTDYITAVEKAADFLAARSDTSFVSPQIIMLMYGQGGNRDRFLYWIERMYIRHDPDLPYCAIKGLNTFQDDPRYVEIMERAGLW